jgi:hypothetical protein
MKRCPACQRYYADDAPNFCGTDGARLVSDAPFSNDPRAATTNAPSFNATAPPAQATDFRLNQAAQTPGAWPTAQASLSPPVDLNPLRKWPSIGWAIMGVSLIVIAACGFLIGFWPRAPIGFITVIAVLMASGVVGVIAGLSNALVMPRQVRKVDALLAGQNLLARWTYSPDEWSRFIQAELARVRRVRIRLLVGLPLVGSVGGGIIGFISAPRDPFILMVALAGGAGLLIGLVTWGANYYDVASRRDRAGSVYISPSGVLMGGRFYSWDSDGRSLVKVAYERGDPDEILFRYSYGTGRGGRAIEDVRVPVPRDHQNDAARLVAYFNRS